MESLDIFDRSVMLSLDSDFAPEGGYDDESDDEQFYREVMEMFLENEEAA